MFWATPERFQQAIKAALVADEKAAIIVLVTPQYVTQTLAIAQIIDTLATHHPERLILSVFIGDESVNAGRDFLRERGHLVYDEIDDAVSVARAFCQRAKIQREYHDSIAAHDYRLANQCKDGKYHALVDALMASQPEKIQILDDHLTQILLDEVGIETPAQKLVSSRQQAIEFARELYPVVAKASNQTLAHKTETGAVITDIGDESSLQKAISRLQQQLQPQTDQTSSEEAPGILIQEMITDSRLEFFIGAKRNGAADVYHENTPGFGHLITFGWGGIYTQVMRELSHFLVPWRRRDIKEILRASKLYPMIKGYRGMLPLAEERIIDAIVAVQKLVVMYPEITALDLNPVLVGSERAVCVDAKIFVARQ